MEVTEGVFKVIRHHMNSKVIKKP